MTGFTIRFHGDHTVSHFAEQEAEKRVDEINGREMEMEGRALS